MDILLGQYKGLKATIPSITYTEDDVNAQIGTLLAGNPTHVNKEGPVAMGDTAVIDYEGFKDGVPFDGGKAEKYPLGIGSGAFIPGFEEQIVGMEIGEDRDINLSFPEQYHAPDLAGKEVVFKVKLHEIYSEKASELNDEFVVSLAIPEVKTVDDLKKHISEYLDYEVQAKKDEASREQLYDQILSSSSCLLPPEAVEAAIDLKTYQLFQKELTVKGSFCSPYDMGRAVELLNAHRIDVTTMLGGMEPLEGLAEVLSSPAKRAKGKFVILPNGTPEE